MRLAIVAVLALGCSGGSGSSTPHTDGAYSVSWDCGFCDSPADAPFTSAVIDDGIATLTMGDPEQVNHVHVEEVDWSEVEANKLCLDFEDFESPVGTTGLGVCGTTGAGVLVLSGTGVARDITDGTTDEGGPVELPVTLYPDPDSI